MVLLVKKKMPLHEAVFADTGAEIEETYLNVEMAKRYLAKRGIPLKVVKSPSGTLFDTCIRRKVIPSQLWRWSTRDYKIRPIHRHYRSLKCHIYEYLGIAYDEIERVKDSKEPYITSLFPLIDAKMTRADCIQLIKKEGLAMPVKSGCFICPFNTVERWAYLNKYHPKKYAKAMWLEEHSKFFPEQKLHPLTLRGLKAERFNGKSKAIPQEQPCGAYCMT